MRILVIVLMLLLSACNLAPADLDSLGFWRSKADTAYQEGRYAEAIDYYKKLTEIVPADAENWFRLGNCYARVQDTPLAIAAYREALVRDRLYAKAWHNLGFNQLRSAQQTFTESLQSVSPNDPMYPILKSYNEKLLYLLDEQTNMAVRLNANPAVSAKSKPFDSDDVKVIVLDDKSASESSKGVVQYDASKQAPKSSTAENAQGGITSNTVSSPPPSWQSPLLKNILDKNNATPAP